MSCGLGADTVDDQTASDWEVEKSRKVQDSLMLKASMIPERGGNKDD